MLKKIPLQRLILKFQFIILTIAAAPCSQSHGEIFFDDFTDDSQPYEYRVAPGDIATWSLVSDGLSVTTTGSESGGGIEIRTEDGPLPESNSWSIRAELTINEVIGQGLAGVGITNPERWTAVLARWDSFNVGQRTNPDSLRINDGINIVGSPFVVQMDFNGESLSGHFWRPETQTDVTTIEYELEPVSSNPGPPRLANNGADATYRAIWLSETVLPLPTGFEDVGDLDGNEIIEFGDIDLLAEQIRGDQELAFDLNADGVVNLNDQSKLIEEYLGTKLGDTDLDGQVAFADFLALSANFGGKGGWGDGDFDASGDVTFSDFLILSSNFALEARAVAVPEPASIQLLFVAAFCLGFRRRKRRPQS